MSTAENQSTHPGLLARGYGLAQRLLCRLQRVSFNINRTHIHEARMPLMARHIRQRAAQHIGRLCSTGPAPLRLTPSSHSKPSRAMPDGTGEKCSRCCMVWKRRFAVLDSALSSRPCQTCGETGCHSFMLPAPETRVDTKDSAPARKPSQPDDSPPRRRNQPHNRALTARASQHVLAPAPHAASRQPRPLPA